jgi:23S rRNA (cytidine1920-2'-O)/16S rRNA (cytidine1409-2'-O)-methyltransferase
MGKRRLDTLLIERGLFPTRSRAAAAVMAGEVRVGPGERRAAKPGELVDSAVSLRVPERPPFVSRGGIKLANALDGAGLEVAGRSALDVGASTGGFTDCLLQRGAREVISVDVGYGTLDQRLRDDPRVHVMERCNARALTPAMVLAARGAGLRAPGTSARTGGRGHAKASLPAGLPDLATIDVSFISLEKVLGAVLSCLAPGYDVLALIKPQFEVGRAQVGKGGVVRDPGLRRAALVGVGQAALALGAAVLGYQSSGLPGPKGNVETFIWLADPAPRAGAAGAGGGNDSADLERMAREVES